MYSFIISLVALILGYVFYGRFCERVIGVNPARPTPAISTPDGVDYVPMPTWKVLMIQFLNIAGTGPIFGAIMGAKFGPSCYLWIVLGSIFAGAVHDFLSGMLSIRSGGRSVPNWVGHMMGNAARHVTLVFSLILLLLVGVVFVYSPALILGDIAAVFGKGPSSIMFWVLVVFAYYIVATMLPIDKLIGKIYPFFAVCMLFMALALMVCLFVKWPLIPELWEGLHNRGEAIGTLGQPVFPCLFLTVACGALSGFHATQSPMMARCIKSESLARPVFYGSMIIEGAVALVWAAVSSWFFFDGGMTEVGVTSAQAPEVVTLVSKHWLGTFGGILAIIGVVAAPITSGDTAFRSARLIISDFLRIKQDKIGNRFLIAVPIFVAASLVLWFNVSDPNGFNYIWRYFGVANQSLAALVLWAGTYYLVGNHSGLQYLLTFIPAAFITACCITFICIDKTCFGLPATLAPWIALGCFVFFVALFLFILRKQIEKRVII